MALTHEQQLEVSYALTTRAEEYEDAQDLADTTRDALYVTIRAAVRDCGLSLREVADITGLSKARVGQIAKGATR